MKFGGALWIWLCLLPSVALTETIDSPTTCQPLALSAPLIGSFVQLVDEVNRRYFLGQFSFNQRLILLQTISHRYLKSQDGVRATAQGAQAALEKVLKGLMSLSAEQRWAGFSQKLLAKVYQGQKLTTAEKRIAAEVTGFEGDFESYLEKQTEHLCYLEDQGIHFSVNGWAFDWNAKLKFTDRAQDPKLRQALELFFPPVIIGALQDPHRRLPLFLGDQVILPEPRSGSSRNKMAMSFSAWKERLAEQLESYQESFRIYAESIQVQSSTTNYLFMDHQEHDAWWKLYETSMRLLEKQRQQLADSGYSDQQLVFLTQQEQALGDRFRENLQGVQSDLKIMKFTAPVLLVATIVAPEFVIPTMGVCLGSSMVVSLGMAGAASAYSDEGYWQAFSRYYLEQGTQTFIYAPAFMLIPMSAGLLAARPLLRQFTPEWLQCS